MVVSTMGKWAVLRVSSADFWFVGDLNARFCPPAVRTKPTEGVTLSTVTTCDKPDDCLPSSTVKGFGL